MKTLLGLIKTMRPKQWVKNVVVLAPLIFAHQLLHVGIALRALAAFGLFCLLASAIYLLNDLVDVDADRAHPVKKARPIAARIVPERVAKVAFVGLVTIVAIGSFLLSPWTLLTTMGYLALNLAYSFKLKRIAYVDVVCIALGFELRVLAGASAASVPPSIHLIVVMFLAAMFLGLGKRLHELAVVGGEARSVLKSYDAGIVTGLLVGFGLATLVTYAMYTLDPSTIERFGTRYLVLSALPAALGMFRFVQLVRRKSHAESPTDAMLRDPLFLGSILVWVGAIMGILYIA